MDCSRLAAAEVESNNNRLEAAMDCSRLAAAEVEVATDRMLCKKQVIGIEVG